MAYTCSRSSKRIAEINRGKELVDASLAGDVVRVERLLDEGVSVNADEYNKSLYYASQNYITPLQVTASKGYGQCVQLLIERGANLNAKDRFDVTAVHMAAENGHYNCLKLLLDAGADCNTTTKNSKPGYYTAKPHAGGTTPLHLAAGKNRLDCVKELIQNGADYNAVDEEGMTSLYIAARRGLEECVMVHLNNAIGRDILSLPCKKLGDTPLHWCVQLGLKNCVGELLKHGSDVNEWNRSGFSSLHLSVFHSPGKESIMLEIMKELVLNGYNTDINLKNDNNDVTPLHYVCFMDGGRMVRRGEAAEFLIAYGANTSITNKRGNNLIQAELKNGNDRTILKAVVKTLPRIPSLVELNLVPPTPIPPIMYEQFFRESPPTREVAVPVPKNQGWLKYQWYAQLASTPRSLQHYCRYSVRTALGYRRLRNVHDLQIPNSLKDYILLQYDEYK